MTLYLTAKVLLSKPQNISGVSSHMKSGYTIIALSTSIQWKHKVPEYLQIIPTYILYSELSDKLSG